LKYRPQYDGQIGRPKFAPLSRKNFPGIRFYVCQA
jgi:hypothetical protein